MDKNLNKKYDIVNKRLGMLIKKLDGLVREIQKIDINYPEVKMDNLYLCINDIRQIAVTMEEGLNIDKLLSEMKKSGCFNIVNKQQKNR